MALIARTAGNEDRSVRCDNDGRLVTTTSGGSTDPASVIIVPKTSFITQGNITTIAGSSKTTIVTYTNVGSVLYLYGVIATGTTDGEYEININSDQIYMRSAEMSRTAQLILTIPIKIAIGTIISVKVTHYDTFTADFDATILGFRL